MQLRAYLLNHWLNSVSICLPHIGLDGVLHSNQGKEQPFFHITLNTVEDHGSPWPFVLYAQLFGSFQLFFTRCGFHYPGHQPLYVLSDRSCQINKNVPNANHQDCKGVRFYTLQVNMLTCPSFMDAGKRPETLGQRQGQQ